MNTCLEEREKVAKRVVVFVSESTSTFHASRITLDFKKMQKIERPAILTDFFFFFSFSSQMEQMVLILRKQF